MEVPFQLRVAAETQVPRVCPPQPTCTSVLILREQGWSNQGSEAGRAEPVVSTVMDDAPGNGTELPGSEAQSQVM